MNEQTALVMKDSNTSQDLITFNQEKVELIKRTIAQNATNDQLALFLHQCQRTGLDPLARQIHCVLRWNNNQQQHDMSIQVAIDGYRLIADRTGKYAGSDDYTFNNDLSQFDHMKDFDNNPVTATSTVYKLVSGVRVPFTATAAWKSYYPGDGKQGFMWRKMPYLMLGKCAEALALRKAFPAELSGIYTREEMEQAGGDWQELPSKDGKSGNGDIIDGDSDWEPPEETHYEQGSDNAGAVLVEDEPEKDTRAETSPQEQQKREEKRPASPTTTENNVDWRAMLQKGRPRLNNVLSCAHNGIPTIGSETHARDVLRKHYEVPEDWGELDLDNNPLLTQEKALVLYDFIDDHERAKGQ